MELDFFNADEIQGNAKCTIHKSGKLGFSMDAIEMLEITEKKVIKIAKGPDYDDTGNLYIDVCDKEEGGAFSISKAGNYFYLNTKNLFNKLGLNYRKEKIIFDIVDHVIKGKTYYKLVKRTKKRN